MKNSVTSRFLPLTALGAGAGAMVLRWALYAVAVDEKNLLPVLHPLEFALWVLTAGAALFLLLQVRKLAGSEAYGDNFAPSILAAVGSAALAAGIAVTVLTMDSTFPGPIGKLWKLAGLLSAPALGAAALFRLEGRKPMFLCHFMVCVFCVLHMVSRYQSWSGNPQLQDYFFCLGSSVWMTLFAYYQTTFDVGAGQRRMQLATGLMGTLFCVAALAHTETPVLYLAGGLWMLTGLCNLNPVTVLAEANPAQDQEENHGAS